MLKLEINRDFKSKNTPSDIDLERWASSAYRGSKNANACLIIVSEEKIKKYNNDYRKKNKSTNVLSFPANLDIIDGELFLGDIIACASVIEKEAKDQNKNLFSHWAHMMIHSMLHLQNFDHADDENAKIMETIEIEALESFNIPNPYEY
jgi:probable rRNA maturation factor